MIFKNNNGLSFSLFGSIDKIKQTTGNFKDVKKALSWFNFEKSIGSTDAQALLNKNIKNTTSSLQDYLKSLNGAKASLGGYTKYLINTNVKTKALELGTKALKFAIDTAVMVGVSWAFSKISESIQKAKQAQEEFRQSQIEAGKTADETNDKLQEYIATYHELAKTGGSADQLKDLQQQIADLVGVQADNLDLVNGKLDDELVKLSDVAIKQAEASKKALGSTKANAGKKLTELNYSKWNDFSYQDGKHIVATFDISEIGEDFKKTLEGYGLTFKQVYGNLYSMLFPTSDDPNDLLKAYDGLLELESKLSDKYKDKVYDSSLYSNITDEIGRFKNAVDAYRDALNAYNQNEAIIAVGENLKTFTGEINDQTSFDNWVNGIIDAEGATGDYADAIREVCESRYPQFKKQTDEAGDSAYKASFQIQSLSNSLSELEAISDKFSKLGSAISEFKEDGYVSIKTINEIAEAFKGTEGLDNYISQIATASNTTQLQNSIRGLINSYLNQKSVLKDLDEENKQLLTTQLQRLGVSNAEEVINNKLIQQLPNLTQKFKNATQRTQEQATALYNLAQNANLSQTELIKYANVLDKVTQLEDLRKRLLDDDPSNDNGQTLVDAVRLTKEINGILDNIKIDNPLGDGGSVKIDIDFPKIEDLSNGNGTDTGSKTNETAEKKIANLKHQHEMGLISEKTYYLKLEKIRRKYYAGKKDYLNRDRELQEEYHKWEVSQAEDGFEKKVESLQKQYANGKITYAELKSKLKKLINTTFKNDKDTKNKYLKEELPSYLTDAKEQKEEKKTNAFNTEVSNLKDRLEMGKITEDTYYKELKKIRDKYKNSTIQDIKDGIKDIDKELHDYSVSQSEISFESKLKVLQENFAKGLYSEKGFKNRVKNLIKSLFKNDKQKQKEFLEQIDDYFNDAQEQKEEKNREKFDSSYDKLKYQFENGFISEETYYKRLDTLYKKHYGNKTKYLDEYSQYSQEVYDGFKDMYKEDLEAKKDSLEKQKEEIVEYYDDLIEKKREEHDAEDYKEEQSEKRKTLSEIERQIAELEKDGSERARARIAELEEEREEAKKDLEDFEKNHAREKEIERLEKEREKREKEVQKKIDSIDSKLNNLDTNTKDIRNAVIQYAKAKGVDIKFAYASGTRSSVGGVGRINEKGIEMISAPDGNGNYIPMLPNSYVFSAKATEFLWKLATEHSLPQAMYSSIAKSIKTQSSTPSVNIAQPITITMGDVIIKGNADKQTVADIKKQQENTVRMVLQKIKELQK